MVKSNEKYNKLNVPIKGIVKNIINSGCMKGYIVIENNSFMYVKIVNPFYLKYDNY